MDVNDLKELYRAAPFQPFELVLTNGTTVQVVHPEFMSFSPTGPTIHVWDPVAGGKRVDVKLIIAVNEDVPRRQQKKKR